MYVQDQAFIYLKEQKSQTIYFIYSSNTRDWLLDHLTPSLPVPNDDVVSRVFIESRALEQMVTIHSGMAAEREDLVSSQWRYTPKKSCPVVRRKQTTASTLSRCLGVGSTVVRVSHGFPKLLGVFFYHSRIFVKACGNNARRGHTAVLERL
ncbi:e3 ubiquitin-protein ligase HERC2 [Trichonephila clavipes]|nr:e3 ubiquitin-protein ligase HERC2 [Trichonephila clavipes]